MRARIVRIGNSQGIRIPKLLLEQIGLQDEVDIEVEEDRLVISRVKEVRSGWEEAFRAMAAAGDDGPLWEDSSGLNSWDEAEWEWK